jgi:3-oxoacyl-[acyl-carrier protein] reductase
VDFGIAGKVALVTAATKGIGLGIAQALAREGARVSVVARTEADVKRVAESLGGFGVAADVLTDEGCERAVKETQSALGDIDILVNNFGARFGTSWSDTGPQEFEKAFAGNVGVSVRFTQRVLPGMLERGWGRVVVISSVFGREAGGAPAYNAAKAAENSMVKSLAREVAGKGVTVNAVAPARSCGKAAAGTGGSRRTRKPSRNSSATKCRWAASVLSMRWPTWWHSSAPNRQAS